MLERVKGKTVPLITTSFWEKEGEFFTIDSEDDFYENRAFLLRLQLMELDENVPTCPIF